MSLAGLLGCAAAPLAEVAPTPIDARHGVVVGDVTQTTALVWTRAEGAARALVEAWPVEGGEGAGVRAAAPVEPARDHTARMALAGLRPDTAYRVRVRFARAGDAEAAAEPVLEGRFRTPPEAGAARAVTLAFGGDVAGQNVCRDAELGFPVFRVLREREPDVFVALGDMIYADNLCQETGRFGNAQVPGAFDRAARLEDFWAHWRYAREDAHLRGFLSHTASVAIWDDHEVVNDFGPHHDTRSESPWTPGAPLLPLGLAAFLDYNPVATEGEDRLYRRLRWGGHLELFVLDNRRYRDPNAAPDTGALPKTMLGAAQRRWLVEGVAASDATWKVVVSSVPIAIPTGAPPEHGRDGWAGFDQDTGFARELGEILGDWAGRGVRNLVFVTTDVHFAQVLRYTPFPEHGSFTFHEVVTGPLHALVAPSPGLDTSLRPEVLFTHAPAGYRAIPSFDEALHWFNFGELAVDEAGTLAIRVVNARGAVLFEERLGR